MTIPKGKAAKAEKAKARLVRPELDRTGPDRSSKAAASADKAPPSSAAGPDATVSQSVAHAVKVGYDVIAENMKQGREAAQRFRHGEYNVREVPGDLEVAAMRLLQLARELSTTTFDVCERLLKEVGAKAPSDDRAAGLPPFRTAKPGGAPSKPAKAAKTPDVAPTAPQQMKITVRFSGKAKAVARTTELARPRSPTAAADIAAQPLAPRNAEGKPIAGVTFHADLSVEGLVVAVTVPGGQAPGVYSGLVYAKGDDVPLGVLTIEIAK